MFREMDDGSLLNLAWVDTYEVVDNKIIYTLVNGQIKEESFESPAQAQEASEDIGNPPEEYEEVNEVEF